MEKNVLVVMPVKEKHKKYLEKMGTGCRFRYVGKAEVSKEDVDWAQVILGNPPEGLLAGAENLDFLQLESAGSEKFVQEGILPDGVLLCNATGAFGLAISECMLAGVLSLYKKMPLYAQNQRDRIWRSEGEVKSIYHATVLSVGMGDIGGEFTKRAKALGAYTVGIRRSKREKPDYLDVLFTMDKLDVILPQADIVAISLPQTKETYRLFDKKRISKMKKDALLINVGRGSAVDTEALTEALEEGRLLGAVLDVTDPEPLPKTHPLWGLSNVILTPHATGGYQLPETFERAVKICGENLRAYLEDKPLKNKVDFQTGYRTL